MAADLHAHLCMSRAHDAHRELRAVREMSAEEEKAFKIISGRLVVIIQSCARGIRPLLYESLTALFRS